MKPVKIEETPEVSGGSENPTKNPPIDSTLPILPSPLYPRAPVMPVVDETITIESLRS